MAKINRYTTFIPWRIVEEEVDLLLDALESYADDNEVEQFRHPYYETFEDTIYALRALKKKFQIGDHSPELEKYYDDEDVAQ
ncbi:hypothetical protein MK805_15270 [Shimazuella sp. AN120528]|uniref:hypothetical protein n=1 Tax=Shimazuella soli TaxID=1892854 RepID=UPI001F0FFA43|nr:hypothetical protein [Shimazuella soli]MCH5586302.1 hypothetical protein [Shimazuella soli]